MKSKPVLCLSFSAILAAGAAVLRAPVAAPSLAARFGTHFAANPLDWQLGEKDPQLREKVVQSFLHLPLRFEQNVGQAGSQARFLARGPGYSLFLTPGAAVLALKGKQKTEDRSPNPGELRHGRELLPDSARRAQRAAEAQNAAVVSLKLVGADPSAAPEGVDPLPGKSNYLIGNDPAQWRTEVASYAKVKYGGVYPGVDLIYHGDPQRLEYDFVVSPGASPGEIEMQVAGGEGMHLDAAGNLIVATGAQPVELHKPVLYQQTPQGRRPIAGSFRLLGDNKVGFETASYNAHLPLVIDPVLSYSTYLGGSGWDQINAIALDPDNNICVTGYTQSLDFPTASPLRGQASLTDAFVTKLSADGSQLIFSTYLGGNGIDVANGIAADSSGNVTVAGYTYSTNFPTAAPFQSSNRASGNGGANAFVTRLNSAGSGLIFSTYYGGSSTEAALAVALDPSGSAYIAGLAYSNNLTLVNPFQPKISTAPDGFVAKFAPGGNALVYSTYLGGSDYDAAQGIAVDSDGNAYVTGATASSNFPRANPIQNAFGGGTCTDSSGDVLACDDVFVTKFNASGNTLAYSTYLGGNGEDSGDAIAVDSSGSVYVTGSTGSGNFPTQNAIQGSLAGLNNAFVTKLSPGGDALVYSTYLGGSVADAGAAIAVDADGNAYVAGTAGSSDFPTVNSIQSFTAQNGSANVFVSKVTPDGSALAYSTYLGGSGFEGAGGDNAASVALDSLGNVYVAGATSSVDFPVANAFQPNYVQAICNNGYQYFPCPDGFISKLSLDPKLFPSGIVNGASFTPNSAVAAGSIVSAFGSDLTSTTGSAGTIPLPVTLANLMVRMNGIMAPFFFASGGQLNLQIPWELAGQAQATVQVSGPGANFAPVTINLAAAAPGLFSLNSSGSGQGAILNSSDSSFAAPTGSVAGATSRPANRGEFITIYCTGLGPVADQPATGYAAGGDSKTTATPTVSIGGIQVTPDFSGLAPTFVGLYQINVAVPMSVLPGDTVPVAITVNGAASNTVQIAVQ